MERKKEWIEILSFFLLPLGFKPFSYHVVVRFTRGVSA
jgi:hypothetical protein